MLAKIALSSSAIKDLSKGPLAHQKKYHREFTELLLRHGVLVFGSEEDKTAFRRSIQDGDGIPIASRQVWQAIVAEFEVKKRLTVICPPGVSQFASLTSLSDLYDAWKYKTNIAVVGEELAQAMKLDEQESGVLEGAALEIATSITVSEGHIIRSLDVLAREGKLKYGQSREAFWQTVLEPLAKCTRNIVITDRYIFERMWDEVDCDTSRESPEHISWLLARLDATLLPHASVKIIAQSRRSGQRGKPKWGAPETARIVSDKWQRVERGSIEQVEIVLAEPRGERPHDRHIRFGDLAVIDINAGFDRLCELTVRQKEGMRWSYAYSPGSIKDYKTAAQSLEARPSYKEVVIR
ncbi:hypothetical protein OIU93_03815 [Paeniglutamicibacter sp. ZC-3]|uniref:hypothetical protein n=1 Tax=Paeniglutamicibacter sp. ZC-3 TaxID=2986919 RepID=UPI0021F78EE5|nr:hypothetical protein [Paeniglutamicibacter sp. ZC-3]MCV9993422.1 hypothetical protein [Paeniglutamicibacter sp. ZC-3]